MEDKWMLPGKGNHGDKKYDLEIGLMRQLERKGTI